MLQNGKKKFQIFYLVFRLLQINGNTKLLVIFELGIVVILLLLLFINSTITNYLYILIYIS